jgi:hypothetical protein
MNIKDSILQTETSERIYWQAEPAHEGASKERYVKRKRKSDVVRLGIPRPLARLRKKMTRCLVNAWRTSKQNRKKQWLARVYKLYDQICREERRQYGRQRSISPR